MISTLIIIFIAFILFLIFTLFELGFVRGEIYDVTKGTPKKGSKSEKMLGEVFKGIEYINSKSYQWHEIKSYDGLKLVARYFKNKDSDKIILLFHGYRSISENDFAGIFSYYYELGYNILLVDQRAHGKSEGKYITFGVKERFDCLSWCEYIDREFKDVTEIFFGGISMGATTVLLASELDLPDKVKGIIADCGFTSPKAIISRVVSSRYGINADVLLPIINILCRFIAKFNVYECSVDDAMKKNQLPILFIHGTSDDFVPSRMSRENYEACKSFKRLLLIDCVMHGVACLQDKTRVRHEISAFLSSI